MNRTAISQATFLPDKRIAKIISDIIFMSFAAAKHIFATKNIAITLHNIPLNLYT